MLLEGAGGRGRFAEKGRVGVELEVEPGAVGEEEEDGCAVGLVQDPDRGGVEEEVGDGGDDEAGCCEEEEGAEVLCDGGVEELFEALDAADEEAEAGHEEEVGEDGAD